MRECGISARASRQGFWWGNCHSPSAGFAQVGGEAFGLLLRRCFNLGQLRVAQIVRPFPHAVVNGKLHGQVQKEKGREGKREKREGERTACADKIGLMGQQAHSGRHGNDAINMDMDQKPDCRTETMCLRRRGL